MKTPERFDRAIKALVKGFFNETLIATDTCACAVGNIVAYGAKIVLKKESYIFGLDGKPLMQRYYNGYDVAAWFIAIHHGIITESALENSRDSGYSFDELRQIEEAFMINRDGSTDTERIFNGLIAVVEVLCEIDGIEPTEYKKAFEYTEDFKPVNAI